MQAQSSTTTATRHPKAFWSSVTYPAIPARWNPNNCPECGQPLEENQCHNVFCTIGLHNVIEAVGQETPEDWLMASVDSSEEPAGAGSPSQVLAEVAA